MSTPEVSPTKEFVDAVLIHWDDAMDRFFDHVENKMRARDLTVEQVREALNNGYGYEVGDAWAEWMEDET